MKAERISARSRAEEIPPPLTRFASFGGDAEITNGKITLSGGEVVRGAQHYPVDAQLKLGDPPEVTFSLPPEPAAAPSKQSEPGTNQSARK
jgi:hypothetical protein